MRVVKRNGSGNQGQALTLEPHLRVFSGTGQLERGDQARPTAPYAYESGDAAFDAAVAALRELLI